MFDARSTRRRLILTASSSAGILVAAAAAPLCAATKRAASIEEKDKPQETEVAAVEDLMREHGVLRRALLVYRQSAVKMRSSAVPIDSGALNRTAKLFRSFGEDYHERQLEEAYILPAIRKLRGPVAAYADVLQVQHDRGRSLTDYILV